MSVAKKALTAAAAVALAAPIAIAASSTAGAKSEAAIIGKWDVVVSVHVTEPPVEMPQTCDFTADHKIYCITKPGQEPLEGNGIWQLDRSGVFSFWVTHPDPNGEINATHLGRIERNRFTTKATAYIYAPTGAAIIGPVTVGSKAKRI
ncbi:hypothetical protein SK571_12410 [Lentzea sp. BCCO 10_0798]|uniref:Lipocalin-like domain-containing protein n=1 Tax=Lentzea kristufekii TaxID=3095430 RepID=A0ABU4TPH7_9PSEU|nr:hypothetical protein [Lentzea sp. BCCO 10_0798]MDX8050184.1 hypothetical protein [Lentzea sp. BCCO 10_0798]